jgi:peroxiredoxin
VPLDESLRRTSADAQPGDRPVVMRAGTGADPSARPLRLRWYTGSQPAPGPAVGQSDCRMDPNDHRIIDFQLPGLDGKMLSFHDLDADVILLDFWGSWCRECRKSIAHLRELPPKFGGRQLQVIGIACEKGASFEERRASAAEAVQRYGIHYPVLLSSMDGSCPLQQALQVQFYPTMVLLDRDGRILHVEQGATDVTLGRIDRSIAWALRDTGTRSN